MGFLEKFKVGLKKFLARYLLKLILLSLLVAIVLTIINLIDSFFSVFLPWDFISHLFTLALCYYVAYNITRMTVFPGSTSIWRRLIENDYMRASAKRAVAKLELMEIVTRLLNGERLSEGLKPEHKMEIPEIRRVIMSLVHSYTKMMNDNKNLSKYQRKLSGMLIKIEQLAQETYIISSDNTINIPLWDSMENGSVLYIMLRSQNVGLKFKNPKQGQSLLEIVGETKNEINGLIASLPWYKELIRALKNDSLGTLDQMRVNLESRYNAQRIQVKSSDGTTLDCMFILGKGAENHVNLSEGSFEHAPQNNSYTITEGEHKILDVGPTVLFCNPNAAFYEVMHLSNEWVDFYVNNGVNILVWNYRGYGASKGLPTPSRATQDGVALFDYLRNTMGIKRLGVHGESIGGMVATHIANVRQVEFICSDRSFADLNVVAKLNYSNFVGYLFNLLTFWWRMDSPVMDYINSTCYKIILVDPRDEMIPQLGSLPFGVTKEVLRRRCLYDKLNKYQLNKYSVLGKLSKIGCLNSMITRYIISKETENYVNNYYMNIASTSDFNMLYFALQRIFHLILSTSKEKRQEKKETSSSAVDESIHNDVTPLAERSTKSEISIPENENLAELNAQYAAEMQDREHSPRLHEINLINEREEQYQVNITPESDSFEELHAFTLRVFSLMELIDSAGCTLNDVFGREQGNQEELFKMFLVNLEIWGSWLPIRLNIKPEASSTEFHHQLGLFKLGEFLKKVEAFIQMHNKNSLSDLLRKIIEDLELVVSKFRSVRERIRQNIGIKVVGSGLGQGIQSTVSTNRILSPNVTTTELNHTTPNASLVVEKKLFLDNSEPKSNDTLKLSINDDLRKQIGFLLPISCGHNGNLSKPESDIFRHHLNKISFMRSTSPTHAESNNNSPPGAAKY